jgi:hypothetical protein
MPNKSKYLVIKDGFSNITFNTYIFGYLITDILSEDFLLYLNIKNLMPFSLTDDEYSHMIIFIH